MDLQKCAAVAVGLAMLLIGTTQSRAQVNPWNAITHGACCEGNLAAWGNDTYVLAPTLATANRIFKSSNGGRTWQVVYPPVNVSVPFGIEGDLAAWGPPGLPDVTVNYFGTQVADGVAAVTNDGGDNWTVVNFPVAFPANDQAWIYMGRLQVSPCDGIPTAVPYVLAGWYRIGSVVLFSCDGGLTWPVETPLVGLNGTGPEHVVCHQVAQSPFPDNDTRIPLASFDKMKAHRHGGWGTDGKFYWTEVAGGALFICKTDDFGATWEGFEHPLAIGTASPGNVVTSMAFDEKGTLYVLHTNKLYVSFNQGESIRFVWTLPRWGNDNSVGDTSGQGFTIDGGTIHIALKQSNHQVWYVRGDNVDSAPVWTEELVRVGGTERLDFIQIVLDGRGVPTIGYTAPGSEATMTSSRDLEPIAVDDEATAIQEQPVVIDVLANDSDPDDTVLLVTAVSDPPNGEATIDPGGTITYVGDAAFTGFDTFTYTLADTIGLTDSATVYVEVTPPVDVGESQGPFSFRLGPINPNPFQGATTVGFEIAARATYSIQIFSLSGQRVATLRDGIAPPGRHQVRWDGTNDSGRPVPAGLYFVRLSAGGQDRTARVLRLR